MTLLDYWNVRLHVDSALSVLVPDHLDVSSVSPEVSVGVLAEPVVYSFEGSVSDDSDAVIEAPRVARFVVVHAALVVHEGRQWQ